MKRKLIVLEFNELCPNLIDRFIDAGDMPNVRALRDSSIAQLTHTDAEGEDLNPWIQWFDVHTGTDWNEHGIKKLNEADQFQGPFTWDVLQDRFGVRSWICGSMNAGYGDNFHGRFLPDPWTVNVSPIPSSEFDTFYAFVSQSVQEHTSTDAQVSAVDFAKCLPRHGVSASTLARLAEQILSERLLSRGSWQRAMLLDQVQFDVFSHYFRREKPDYATFFSNSVAHYQHHYWKDYEPELFGDDEFKPDDDKAQAIHKAYMNVDSIVGKALRLAGDETGIMFLTGLSQQPYVKNSRHYYHIISESAFREAFAIPVSLQYKPVMAHQFYLEAGSSEQAGAVADRLQRFQMESDEFFHIGGRKLFLVTQKGSLLDVQCRCTRDVPADTLFVDSETGEKRPFYDVFYRIEGTKSGMHHPDGLYWFKDPNRMPARSESRVRPAQVHHDIIEFFAAQQNTGSTSAPGSNVAVG